MGKNMKKNISNHLAIHQKLTQHCKSIILKKKKKSSADDFNVQGGENHCSSLPLAILLASPLPGSPPCPFHLVTSCWSSRRSYLKVWLCSVAFSVLPGLL